LRDELERSCVDNERDGEAFKDFRLDDGVDACLLIEPFGVLGAGGGIEDCCSSLFRLRRLPVEDNCAGGGLEGTGGGGTLSGDVLMFVLLRTIGVPGGGGGLTPSGRAAIGVNLDFSDEVGTCAFLMATADGDGTDGRGNVDDRLLPAYGGKPEGGGGFSSDDELSSSSIKIRPLERR